MVRVITFDIRIICFYGKDVQLWISNLIKVCLKITKRKEL